MANKKSAKKTSKKIDFKDSVKAIKETAKTVNTRVKTVADEVTEDLMENSGHFKDYAVASAKEAYGKAYDKVNETVETVTETVAENITVEKISKVVKNINDYTLKTADEFVDRAYENGEKWQEIAGKAVKGGLKLAGKQQEIVFDTLETVKGQLTNTAVRMRKLFFN